MSRTGWIRAVALISGLTLASRAEAQGPNGTRAGYGGIDLLGHPLVRADLKLDASQLERVKGLPSAFHARQGELFAQLEGLAGEDRAKKVRELNARLAEEEGKALAGLLEPRQLARFRQIDLQQRGASAWLDPAVDRDLGLSPEQSAKLAGVLNDSMVRQREAQSSTRGDRRASFEKVQLIRKETDVRAVAILAEKQQATWRELIGQPLELNPPRKGR